MKRKYSLGLIALTLVAILGAGIISAFGFGNENLKPTNEQRTAIQNALESGDYDSWKNLMEQRIANMQNQINEETFAQMRERHQEKTEFKTAMQEAKESGDFSKIQELKEQYGFKDKGFEMKIRHNNVKGECPFA